MLSHYNVVSNLVQIDAAEGIESDDTLIGILPFYHIYGMVVIMGASLHAGATVVTMPRFDLEQFLGLIERHRVTTGYLVPPIVLALAKHPLVEKYDVSSLRNVMSGAAPLAESVARDAAARCDMLVRQGYGLTETSPVTHTNTPKKETRITSVGTSLPNTEWRIVDVSTGADAPTGELGEVCIRGPQVMQGYLNNPEATRAMIDDDGWLHTGDIGRADADAYLYVVDRLKELIKYKGFQVAPAEIEAAVQSHPAVADAAVIPSPDEEAGEVPKAFVVLRDGGGRHRRRDHGPRGRARRAAQEGAAGRVHRRHPEGAVREDPAPPARRARARGPSGLSAGRRACAGAPSRAWCSARAWRPG